MQDLSLFLSQNVSGMLHELPKFIISFLFLFKIFIDFVYSNIKLSEKNKNLIDFF